MVESYKTVYMGGEEEIIEKKSRFIAVVEHVESEEEALAFIEAVRKKHWNATHNCFAYIIGTKQPLMRCSDDGEPSGTAGRPMLDVLMGAELCNIVVVVTRYFGGTLLGTGGLVRAYSGAVKAGLAGSMLITRRLAKQLTIVCDYTWIGKIQYLAAQMKLRILETDYSDLVKMVLLVPVQDSSRFEKQITEATNAQVKAEETAQLYYAEADGECLLFDH
ncbi:MAG: YigZ family protein [Lachnospiraceae bacterium]|nr:YigZ family protein [Lachnospiraceae bacterium]